MEVNDKRVVTESAENAIPTLNPVKKKYYLFWFGALLLIATTVMAGFVWFQFSQDLSKVNVAFVPNKTSVDAFIKLNETLLPRSIQLNDSVALRMAEEDSNLAATYWERWRTATTVYRADVTYCFWVQLTSPLEISSHNRYWQKMIVEPVNQQGGKFNMFLYNAYYDDRIRDAPAVKLLTVKQNDTMGKNRDWWCLLWFDGMRVPVLVNATDSLTMMSDNPGSYHTQLITCPVPSAYVMDIPQAVSLQSRGTCLVGQQPSNVLRVVHNAQKPERNMTKRSIGVCAKALRISSRDQSLQLVEWLEMVRLMGADKVHLYVYAITEKMRKVLRHYQADGLVEWRLMTLPGEQPNVDELYDRYALHLGERFLSQELLELNDCLYRNLHQHDYLAVINLDEMIMPQSKPDWHSLIDTFETYMNITQSWESLAYLSNRYALMCEESEELERQKDGYILFGRHPIPSYLYMMRHTFRADPLPSGVNEKSFIRPELVHTLHSNLPKNCLNSTGYYGCQGVEIEPQGSLLLHYRRQANEDDSVKSCTIRDRSAWRHYEQLEKNVRHNLEQIF